jgi:hypothetical protein
LSQWRSFRTSFGVEGGPSTFPTVQSTSLPPRVAPPHQCAGMRLKPHQKHCCSRRSISSQNRRDCGSERGCARSLRNSLHGRGPAHSPLNTCSRHFKRPLYVLRLRTRQTSVLSPGIVAFFEVLLDGSAPRWCASVHQPLQWNETSPPPSPASSWLERRSSSQSGRRLDHSSSLRILWPWASVRLHGP